MKLLRNLLGMLFLTPIVLFGQELAGTVTSGGNPVVGANVAIKE